MKERNWSILALANKTSKTKIKLMGQFLEMTLVNYDLALNPTIPNVFLLFSLLYNVGVNT